MDQHRLNPYWGLDGITDKLDFSGQSYCNRCEANLLQGLYDEVASLYGISCYYILRTDNNVDLVFGESIGAVYKHKVQVSVIPMDQTIDLGRATITQYGFNIDAMSRFQIGASTLTEAIKSLRLEDREYPSPGDLLYVPIWQALFQINYVNQRIKNQFGLFPMMELTCQIFDQGDGTFLTGIPEVDEINERTKELEKMRPNEVVNVEMEETKAEEKYPQDWSDMVNHSSLKDIFVKE